ncbi:TraR/DksA family transcriptional regulator [Pseudactinotalea sp.]|uniref:TraR/DksA family transcriptional regulator n=1 Tax=Pseudactinotalea sp. TaxID=1926260 RepID=UPI003B3BA8A1
MSRRRGVPGSGDLPSELFTELRAALLDRLRDAQRRLSSLTGHFQDIVDASAGSNADDEHDPEGATIAFERSQVDALARDTRQDIDEVRAALERLDNGSYGTCEVCGRPIAVERLQVRPAARTCVGCA